VPATSSVQAADVPGIEDVRRLALRLPETGERPSYGGVPAWHVRRKGFVWERPLRGADRTALGEAAPEGVVVGFAVADLGVKEALLAVEQGVFTIPHLDDYPAVLVALDDIPRILLEELVVDAWLAKAPKRLAAALLAER